MAAEDVDVWRIDADRCDVPAAWAGAAELRRARTLHDPREARRHVATHATLVAILAAALERDPRALRIVRVCSWCGDSGHGKPALVEATDPPLDFSLTRRGAVALLAVAHGRAVGVDVEPLHQDVDWAAVARRTFAASERRRLDAALRWWVRREAIAKATGAGLALDFGRLDTASRAPADGWTRVALPAPWAERCARVLVADLDVGGGMEAAIATTAARPPQVRLRSARV